MATEINIFNSFKLSPYELKNRMVMAPMTRLRAGAGYVPGEMNATYYTQRASAGLIVTECTQVSRQGTGYVSSPGIYTPEQIKGWQLVTDSVHKQGGLIFLQLWHCGRQSHPLLQENGELPVAPSAIAPEGTIHTTAGKQDYVAPRALETDEIPGIIEDFRKGAENAMEAGFDGVELHGAFGYLIDQFLQDGTNQRTDKYGGSPENRSRFLLELTEAVASVWGENRVGIKISPSNTLQSMSDSNPEATFGYLCEALNRFDLAYVHVMEPNPFDLSTGRKLIQPTTAFCRQHFKGNIITNGDYDKNKANGILADNGAELVSFGRMFLANPDLPKRFAVDGPLNEPNPARFYGGGEDGYTDYPFLGMNW